MRSSSYVLSTLACVLLLGLSACGSTEVTGSVSTTDSHTASTGGYKTVDVLTTWDALKVDEEAQLVDVREPGEWAATGVPPGAVLIPLGELEQRAPGELAKDGPVYVICNSGNRSRAGAETLLSLGYAEVYNVDGGIQAWLQAGLPVETYRP